MATPGYGKRSAPGQRPHSGSDFTRLPYREASIAAYIDRMPDGAAVDVKTLARDLPAYGQQAVRTALNALSAAGHLRRIRETVGEGRSQWVSRTYFSRTARSDDWWAAFVAGDVPDDEASPAPPVRPTVTTTVPVQAAAPRPARSEAYEALAALGRTDPRMMLSAADCAALEPFAAEWLARGVRGPQFVYALTAGLPPHVHCAGALARRRLSDKMPPEVVAVAVVVPRILECTRCGVPGRPEALSGGLCRCCRGDAPPPGSDGPSAAEIRARVDRLRTVIRAKGRSRT
ncbi:hypothetical protein [Streptomyces sp. RKAG337]|uniref:hypothetical protein n=1 Tax=Streptomyces sp. RKAG337 TaxID=2893404 RepID=UPI00203342B3|nr:hypothetical protein [Streptomyces sp. RKAG337]MCM2426667.1 hypothetical protein [Streptomyces sp. RKAG337]